MYGSEAGRAGSTPETPFDLGGVGRLLGAAVVGVTDIVEQVHGSIAGSRPDGRTRGITGLVYRSVRGVTRTVGPPAEAVLTRLTPLLDADRVSSPRREAVLAALNGVYGDYLVASGNPLAVSMCLRRDGRVVASGGRSLASDIPHPTGRLLVLVHGLCMNDLQWTRAGHDHGASLARDLGYTPVYLQYNSGRHVSENGREFAGVLERLVREWPTPVSELVIVGHSMGGLVSRSACHYGELGGHAWPRTLSKLVFLGTPHHGAPLERAGNRVNLFCEISPYTAPFTRLGMVRSAGIQDLRHGNLLDDDWQGRESTCTRDTRRPVPLPRGVQCFAAAATRQPRSAGPARRLPGDGLVPVRSALGHHDDSARTLPFPASHRHVAYGSSHFDLLGSPEVYERIRRWLA